MIEEHRRRTSGARAVRIVVAVATIALLVVALVRFGPAVAGKAGALVPGLPLRGRVAAAPAKGFLPVEPGRAACGLQRGMTQWDTLQALRELGHPRRTAAMGGEFWVFGDRAETYATGGVLIGVRFSARPPEAQPGGPPSATSPAQQDALYVDAVQCFRASKLGSLTTGMSLTEAVAELGKPAAIFYWESDDERSKGRPEEMILAYRDRGLAVIVEVATNQVVGFMVLAKGAE